MITPRRHLLTAPILCLVACSTQHLDGDEYYQPFRAYGEDIVSIGASVPEGTGRLRMKSDGKFLVVDTTSGTDASNATFVYAVVPPWPHTFLPAPARVPLDLVDDAGQTVLHVEPVTPPGSIWLHDSRDGLVAETLNLIPDDDPTTVQVQAINVSGAERLIVWRCVGSVNCPNCGTSPSTGTTGEFSVSDCEALVTVGPGERWTSRQEPTDVSAGAGAACLAVQDEGSTFGPTCLVELNRSGNFHERSYILIDGWPTYQPGAMVLQ